MGTENPESGIWSINNFQSQRPLGFDTGGDGAEDTVTKRSLSSEWSIESYTAPQELLNVSSYCCYYLNLTNSESTLTVPANDQSESQPLLPTLFKLAGDQINDYPWHLALIPARTVGSKRDKIII
jgi:hypothetical protein